MSLKSFRCHLVMITFALSLISLASASPRSSCDAVLDRVEAIKHSSQFQDNPLFFLGQDESGFFDFSKATPFYFQSGLYTGLRLAKARLEALRSNPHPPTFANTIEALDQLTLEIDPLLTVFFSYLGLRSTPELEAIAARFTPEVSNFNNSIYFDEGIFKRVEIVRQNQAAGLTAEQRRLLNKTYDQFIKNGVRLDAAAKSRVNQLDTLLSLNADKFRQNVNFSTENDWVEVTNSDWLAGLEKNSVAAAKLLAEKKGRPNSWVFSLRDGVVLPVLRFAQNRELREVIWRKYMDRASTGRQDNTALVVQTVQARLERAKLLGYSHHTDFQTEDRMAKSKATVDNLIQSLHGDYLPLAKKELAELRAFAKTELQPWDLEFYSNKLKEERYSFQEAEVKAYLPFDRVLGGAFMVAERLFGLRFVQRTDISTWHPEVRTFEVQNEQGQRVGLYYIDPIARDGKRPGAWMNAIQLRGVHHGRSFEPQVMNVMNFPKPIEGEPFLLNLENARTVFHEFGHALHGLLSKTNYQSLASPQVAWDAVEVPSKLFELFLFESSVMKHFARHHQTGEPIPDSLIAKISASLKFQIGMSRISSLRVSRLDMLLHDEKANQIQSRDDLMALEKQLEPFILISTPPLIRSLTMLHLFSGGYSGGLYSYLWSETLAADAFELFREHGILDRKIGQHYAQQFLSVGNSIDAAQAFKNFRGREPDPRALLKVDGLR